MRICMSLSMLSTLVALAVAQDNTTSIEPTMEPTFFFDNRTDAPSVEPSELGPTAMPSISPSSLPSDTPSTIPTAEPTFAVPSVASARFRQDFRVENGRLFDSNEQLLFRGLYASYTPFFAPPNTLVDERIATTCIFESQNPTIRNPAPGRRVSEDSQSRNLHSDRTTKVTQSMKVRLRQGRQRGLQDLPIEIQFITVDFTMQYESNFTNVTIFPASFQLFVNSNLDRIPEQMQLIGLDVSEAFLAGRVVSPTPPTVSPTITPRPSTGMPSFSPSRIPSDMPSLTPTDAPVTPTNPPTGLPTPGPTLAPLPPNEERSDAVVISVSVVIALLIVAIGLFVYYRKRKENGNQAKRSTNTASNDDPSRMTGMPSVQQQQGGIFVRNGKSMDQNGMNGVVASPSVLSQQSLLSAGSPIDGDSGDEVDTTHNLADEFDQYKDQNLEKMRLGVEGTVDGFDGMMSQALTRALLDDDETNVDPVELLWGGSGHLVGAEIEASALSEVTDWLKRKESPTDTERKLFMQDTLNKMVSSVRHGVLGPDEASRSIHECAALLGLKLATEIPVTTLIVTGMRKTVTAAEMMETFIEFGEISEAAVASNQRGFGIVRFKSRLSVDLAMQSFRNGEIVVQDVFVQVKVLESGSSSKVSAAADGIAISSSGSDDLS